MKAGRGPIVGPLVVAGAILIDEIDGLNDSKQLSEKKEKLLKRKKKIKISYCIYRC